MGRSYELAPQRTAATVPVTIPAAVPVAVERCRSTTAAPPGAKERLILLFPEDPGFPLRLENASLDLRRFAPPVAVTIAPGRRFRAGRARTHHRYYRIQLDEDYLTSLVEELYDLPRLEIPAVKSVSAELVEDARRLALEPEETSAGRLMAESLSRLFVVDLLQSLLTGQATHDPIRPHHPGTTKVRRLLRSAYRSDLRLEDLAPRAGLAPSQLIAVFKRDTGLTPHQYLRRVRITEAKRMLRSGNTIADTAYAVGFTSLGGFSEAFTDIAGMSPKQFRSLVVGRGRGSA